MNYNIITKIQNLFCLESGEIDEEVNADKIKMDRWTVLDPSQIIAITTKTKEAKRIFSLFDINISKQPDIDYDVLRDRNVDDSINTRYAVEYLKPLLEIAYLDSDVDSKSKYIKISAKEHSPIEIETKNFFLYLAPRLGGNYDD